ncbi:D-isomer specific 2-hydroxyacid dehydrogenase family protein [uncultured Eubacteriales bacterium]|uniref:D-3-phosphoglycerate dehydrogenase n=1 Tax=uncultured Eubacteriales bacterium TaxID=172733 RepID=A0A212IYS2_9FIRM|nr:D-isomer specific 2-hydroxyacid dehydrogenase family protein [uncultured Eubacteriales bacterium]
MFRVKTLNKIAAVGLAELPEEQFTVGDELEGEDGILVRSAKLHDYMFPESLQAIARAGAGVNNIPIDKCSEAGVVVFNTPGANANAVKELVICAMLMASRDIAGGLAWVKEQAASGVEVADVVEKGKAAFVGPEVYRKRLGVIGLGAIGALVCNVALSLGMEVYGYDPYLSVDNALRLDRHIRVVKTAEEVYQNADYISVHVPYMADTKGFINAAAIGKMRDGVRIINLARGELVNDDDILAALESGKVARYVTDFPTTRLTLAAGVVALPHLGASTPESEDNCAVMAAQELRDYLENGNIKNSVNLPTLEQEWSGIARLCIIHHNIPGTIAAITSVLSKERVNVENMTNKSKKDYAYTVVDINAKIGGALVEEIKGIDGVLRIRVLER